MCPAEPVFTIHWSDNMIEHFGTDAEGLHILPSLPSQDCDSDAELTSHLACVWGVTDADARTAITNSNSMMLEPVAAPDVEAQAAAPTKSEIAAPVIVSEVASPQCKRASTDTNGIRRRAHKRCRIISPSASSCCPMDTAPPQVCTFDSNVITDRQRALKAISDWPGDFIASINTGHLSELLASQIGLGQRLSNSEVLPETFPMAAHRQRFLFQFLFALSGHTMSTAFSGIDAPGCGSNIWAHTLALRGLENFRNPGHGHGPRLGDLVRHTSAIEWDAPARAELSVHPHGPQHIHTDINLFLTSWAQLRIDQLKDRGQPLTVESLHFIYENPRLSVSRRSLCSKCDRHCEYDPGSIHWAGTPCVDFSPMGSQKGGEGKSALCFATWCALMLLCLPPLIIHENSHRFLVEILIRIFHKFYVIESFIVCASSYGNPIRRRRRWSVLRLKGSVHKIGTASMETVLSHLFRNDHHDFTAYLVADRASFDADLAWASSRPTSACKEGKEVKSGTDSNGKDYVSFRDALTSMESEFLNGYIAGDSSAGKKIHNLSQDPFSRPISSGIAGQGQMLSLIKSCEVLWATFEGRWVHPLEMLSMQGFPVFPCMVGSKSSAHSFGEANARRSRIAMTSQAGNSMHVSVVGAIWLYVCLFFQRTNSDEQSMHNFLATWHAEVVGEEL